MTMSARQTSIAIYTRSNVPDAAAHLKQYAAAHAAAKEKFGATSTVTYSDDGYEGTTLHRPGLKAMLRDVDAGNIRAIVVTSSDRLSGSYVDYLRLQLRFELAGIAVHEVRRATLTAADALAEVATTLAAAIAAAGSPQCTDPVPTPPAQT
ncbi:recombinase family protein [Lysobacter antibioticus]|uniref:recombinase family protein n=1 Tax=Lysobacter antibioticus TaxID=84531 RepID=UPI0009DE4355|nr:recombinase family protein [Lysobacter antibioticus]